MGGDGGTVAANRAYLRGAGKANHTADRARGGAIVRDDDASRTRAALYSCAISGTTLDHRRDDVVVCPYGKLYRREAAIESLLSRRGLSSSSSPSVAVPMIGDHVRGMRDLHPARFLVSSSSLSSSSSSSTRRVIAGGGGDGGDGRTVALTCPITGSDIGGGNVPCYVIVRSGGGGNDDVACDGEGEGGGGRDGGINANGPNVLSERAIREMGIDGLQEEYGPFLEGDMIRLAPPISGGVFENIRKRWEERMEGERIAAKIRKREKKRKRDNGGGDDDGKNDKDDVFTRPNSANATTTTTTAQSPSSVARPSSAWHDEGAPRMMMTKMAAANGTTAKINTTTTTTTTKEKYKSSSAADEARSTVMSAMAHNPVLSDLFGGGSKKDGGEGRERGGGIHTEKERRDALFTRNC